MKVSDVMSENPRTVSPHDAIRDVAQAMKDEGAGFIPVCDEDRVVGVITDRDIVLRCLAEGHVDSLNESAEHCMSMDVTSVQADADLEEAARLMEEREIRRLPVMRDGRLVGVLSHGNMVQATRSEGPGDAVTLGVTRGA